MLFTHSLKYLGKRHHINRFLSLPGILREYAFVVMGVFSLTFSVSALAEPVTTILYPKPLSVDDHRPIYPVRLLALAISKLNKPYKLKPSKGLMNQSRALRMLGTQNAPDIVWTMTSKDREETYTPIRIPLYKGLIGWRLFLIHASAQSHFDQVSNLAGLQAYTAGQGHDWPDSYILTNSKIDVMSSSMYERLFMMLDSERFDFFPRSIIEIWNEIEYRPQYNLAVEKHLLLRYPAAVYYFVNANSKELAADIERGLQIALEDGSFDLMFEKHNQWLIDKSNLSERNVIDLPNPLLPERTPLKNPALWYQIEH